jgi:ferric-dicitrate binding protein FerR (iron transport regulator)
VNPGVSREGEVIFTVAPDASGFTLETGDTDMFADGNAYVDLGF